MAVPLSGHGQRGEGRELVPQIWVEALDRLDQPEVADLDNVLEGLASVLKLAREKVDEVVVGVDQLGADAVTLGRVSGFLVAAVQRPQLLPRKPRGTTHDYSVRRTGFSLPGA